ncbi:MAG TPA: hypothetical protein VF078_13320 [Nitrospira sp.]
MERPLDSLVTWTQVVYALHAFSLLTGILCTVVGAFLTGWPSIIAVISAHMIREHFCCNCEVAAATSQHAVSRHVGGRTCRSVGQQTVQVCLPSSRVRAPVSLGDSSISRRTVTNNVG